MDANEARDLAYNNSPLSKYIQFIDECIKKAATNGKYEVDVAIHEKLKETTIEAIKKLYVAKGFTMTFQFPAASVDPSYTVIFHIDWNIHIKPFQRLMEMLKAGGVSYPR